MGLLVEVGSVAELRPLLPRVSLQSTCSPSCFTGGLADFLSIGALLGWGGYSAPVAPGISCGL